MIRPAKEGAITWFPDLEPSAIPHRLPKGISVHLRGVEIGLEIQGLVGAVPLLNGDTLQIRPKISQVNFLRLLFRAEGVQRDLEREYDDFVSYSVEDDRNIDSIVARQLLVSADEIMKRSPQSGRVKRRGVGVFAVGRMDALASALNVASHKQEPVVYFLNERTLNIPENRVLTEAIRRAWPMMDEAAQSELASIRDRWMARFPSAEDLGSDLEHVEGGFSSGTYGGPRDYYRKALMLSQIVLGSNGLGFREGAVVEGDAVLLNTADIFEKYLRNAISDAYSHAGYVVTKGGVGKNSLYTDGSFELEPDIVISKDGRQLLIADAKYKDPTAGDHYQMHTYLAASGVKRGLILAPRFEGGDVVVREYSTAEKRVVREVFLPMNNLAATESLLRVVIQRFAG